MKELETIKQLKPHPHVIKLLGCVTDSGEVWFFNKFCSDILIQVNKMD